MLAWREAAQGSGMADLAHGKRPLVALLTANIVSITGNVFTTLAVPWFVLTSTGSVSRTGLASVASTLPIVISAGTAGALVDHLGLRRTSVASDLFSGLIVLAIPVLYLTTRLPFWLLLVLLFIRWFLATPGDTARQAMLPDLAAQATVPIQRATAAFDGVYRAGRMAGASLAGVLILVFGPISLLFIDAATFLLSALLIGGLVPRITHKTDEPGLSRYLPRLQEGMAFLWRDPILRSVVVIFLVSNMLDTGLSQVLLPTYARTTAHDPRVFGFLVAAVGAGAVAGTIAYGVLGTRLPPRITLAICMLAAGAPRPLVLAAGAPFAVAVAVTAAAGFMAGAINPLIGAIQYDRIPARLRARVLGASTAGAYAGMPLGGVLASTLADLAGLRVSFVVFAVLYVLLAVPPLLGGSWRTATYQTLQSKPSAQTAPQP
jgi:MFS family permease